ncbi:hypothetical protein AMTRI_Chr05g68020 [Amborella trichopoda]
MTYFGYTCNSSFPNREDRQYLSKHFSTSASSPHQSHSHFGDPQKLHRKAPFASEHEKAPHHKTQEGQASPSASSVNKRAGQGRRKRGGKDRYKHLAPFNCSLYSSG